MINVIAYTFVALVAVVSLIAAIYSQVDANRYMECMPNGGRIETFNCEISHHGYRQETACEWRCVLPAERGR